MPQMSGVHEPRIAIAQIAMHWTTRDNLAAIERAMRQARAAGAAICAFSELALTGFHREILREARPEVVDPALAAVRQLARELGLAVSLGAPSFGAGGERFITQLLIDEDGDIAAAVHKVGLHVPERAVFTPGQGRPVGRLAGQRCSAVICREVADLDAVARQLPPGGTDLVFVPGALRHDPALPRGDRPAYMADLERLAATLGAWVVQTNWPNALNRPEDSVDGGRSIVVSPAGETVIELPGQAAGLGLFTLGKRVVDWYAEGS